MQKQASCAESETFVWKIKNGDLDEVKAIVETDKCIVNADLNGRCPLHYAADYGQKEVMEYLLDKGANINLVDKYGITPLLAAIYEGHKDCVALLLNKGADKTGKTQDGQSYSDCAESEEIKKLLK